MKSYRNIRVIPVVVTAIFCLAVLKVAGLVLDGGYVFDYNPQSSKASWAQDMLNFPGGPRKSDLDVTGKGGVGQATIRLPRDVGVRAHAAGGIGSVDAEGLKKDGSDYTNEMWGKTPHKITLDVQGGIGSIELLQE